MRDVYVRGNYIIFSLSVLSYIPLEFDCHIERGGTRAKKVEAARIIFLCVKFLLPFSFRARYASKFSPRNKEK